MTSTTQHDALVIGTGIIGVTAAHYLQQAGRRVTLLERGDVAHGASFGNAGILAFPEIIPIASPGAMRKAPKWLFDPLGPLSVPPAYALKIAPWLWRFWKACSPSEFARTVAVQAEMMRLAAQEMKAVTSAPELAGFVRNTGTLDLYDSEASFNAASADWEKKAKAGFEFSRIGRAELDALQPGLAPQFRHAIHTPGGLQIGDPYEFTKAISELVVSRGAELRKGDAMSIAPTALGARVALAGGEAIEAKTVVIACGAWSKPLAASLGDVVPLETERGYNTTLPETAFPLERQLYFNDHGFVVTPLAAGIRVGGAVELGGLDLTPNFRRSEALLAKAQKFLPGLKQEGGRQWMGFRPSLPDCLPVIGQSGQSQAVIYAFGHGHLGLTQSAATGRLVSEIAQGQAPSIAVEPLRASRFAA